MNLAATRSPSTAGLSYSSAICREAIKGSTVIQSADSKRSFGGASEPVAEADIYPVRFVLDKLLALDAPYSPREIVTVLAIVRHMNPETRTCFPAYERISRQTRVSVRDIQRVLHRHCVESPLPLLSRKFVGDKRSYTYELVLNPEEFARVRDAQPKRERRRRKVTPQKPIRKAPQPIREPITARRRERLPRACQCDCGASVVRFDDGRVFERDINGIATINPHICGLSGRTNGPTNTSASESADRPNGPTNTSTANADDGKAATACA